MRAKPETGAEAKVIHTLARASRRERGRVEVADTARHGQTDRQTELRRCGGRKPAGGGIGRDDVREPVSRDVEAFEPGDGPCAAPVVH